jgi:hypothetical protein
LNDGEDDIAGMYEDAGLLIDGPGGGSTTMDAHAAMAERLTSGAHMIHC